MLCVQRLKKKGFTLEKARAMMMMNRNVNASSISRETRNGIGGCCGFSSPYERRTATSAWISCGKCLLCLEEQLPRKARSTHSGRPSNKSRTSSELIKTHKPIYSPPHTHTHTHPWRGLMLRIPIASISRHYPSPNCQSNLSICRILIRSPSSAFSHSNPDKL